MKSWRGLNRWQSVFVFVVVIVVFALFATIRTSWPVNGPDFDLETITVLDPVVGLALFWSSTFIAIGLLGVAMMAKWRPIIRYPVFALLLSICAFPCSCANHVFNNLAPWTLHGQITAADGTTYVFCDSSFLQGQMMAITRAVRDGGLVKSFEVLVTTNGDSPRSWASVIRPANPTEGYGQLYLTADDILIGIRNSNQCYLAYDLRSQHPISHGDIEAISPFICLEQNSALHHADVATTIDKMEKTIDFLDDCDDIRHVSGFLGGNFWTGYPSASALRKGLKHDNPQVRDVAAQLLSVHTDGVALIKPRVSDAVVELCARLASSEVATRREAAQALGGIAGPCANGAVDELTQVAASDIDQKTRLYASQTLGLIGIAAVPSLIELTRHNDSSVRSDAIYGLQTAGSVAYTPETISALEVALNDDDEYVRSRAAKLLEEIRQWKPTAVID